MTTDLMRRGIPHDQFEQIQALGPMIHGSRLFGVASPEQAIAIMVKGVELGLSSTAAFEFIHIIESKPTISPRGALALIYRSGLLESLNIKDEPGKCTVTMKRKGGIEYTSSWSLDDARRAGIYREKSNWEKYPANMCRWRAIGYVADVVFPDVLAGMTIASAFDVGVSAEGDIIEAEVV